MIRFVVLCLTASYVLGLPLDDGARRQLEGINHQVDSILGDFIVPFRRSATDLLDAVKAGVGIPDQSAVEDTIQWVKDHAGLDFLDVGTPDVPDVPDVRNVPEVPDVPDVPDVPNTRSVDRSKKLFGKGSEDEEEVDVAAEARQPAWGEIPEPPATTTPPPAVPAWGEVPEQPAAPAWGEVPEPPMVEPVETESTESTVKDAVKDFFGMLEEALDEAKIDKEAAIAGIASHLPEIDISDMLPLISMDLHTPIQGLIDDCNTILHMYPLVAETLLETKSILQDILGIIKDFLFNLDSNLFKKKKKVAFSIFGLFGKKKKSPFGLFGKRLFSDRMEEDMFSTEPYPVLDQATNEFTRIFRNFNRWIKDLFGFDRKRGLSEFPVVHELAMEIGKVLGGFLNIALETVIEEYLPDLPIEKREVLQDPENREIVRQEIVRRTLNTIWTRMDDYTALSLIKSEIKALLSDVFQLIIGKVRELIAHPGIDRTARQVSVMDELGMEAKVYVSDQMNMVRTLVDGIITDLQTAVMAFNPAHLIDGVNFDGMFPKHPLAAKIMSRIGDSINDMEVPEVGQRSLAAREEVTQELKREVEALLDDVTETLDVRCIHDKATLVRILEVHPTVAEFLKEVKGLMGYVKTLEQRFKNLAAIMLPSLSDFGAVLAGKAEEDAE